MASCTTTSARWRTCSGRTARSFGLVALVALVVVLVVLVVVFVGLVSVVGVLDVDVVRGLVSAVDLGRLGGLDVLVDNGLGVSGLAQLFSP